MSYFSFSRFQVRASSTTPTTGCSFADFFGHQCHIAAAALHQCCLFTSSFSGRHKGALSLVRLHYSHFVESGRAGHCQNLRHYLLKSFKSRPRSESAREHGHAHCGTVHIQIRELPFRNRRTTGRLLFYRIDIFLLT